MESSVIISSDGGSGARTPAPRFHKIQIAVHFSLFSRLDRVLNDKNKQRTLSFRSLLKIPYEFMTVFASVNGDCGILFLGIEIQSSSASPGTVLPERKGFDDLTI
jgi:hypothetical protein